MKLNEAFEKSKRKIRGLIVSCLREKTIYPWLYPSYWHKKIVKPEQEKGIIYFAARPNPGAGIGHQMANWIAGFWFAQQFNLKFAHIPFSTKQWEDFLGFGMGEIKLEDLKKRGFKIRRIPLFDEYRPEEVRRINEIIKSYSGENVCFLAEQDQFYHDQFGVMEKIQYKFYNSPAREKDHLIYDSSNFNLAIHVRRGDIVQKKGENNPNLTIRYLSNEYFVHALDSAMEYLKSKKNIHIYFFSQGRPEDYLEFKKYENIHFCLDMNAQDSFLHMVYADALITSKSSFSYKPALLNKGIKFCPAHFWHGYPKADDWILLNDEGKIICNEQ